MKIGEKYFLAVETAWVKAKRTLAFAMFEKCSMIQCDEAIRYMRQVKAGKVGWKLN